MKKKLLSLIVGSIMLVPTLSSAVGLGSVRTYSGLNEHLSAEIPVLSVKTRENMQVSLAPNSVFSQNGVVRAKVLSNLNIFLAERGGRIYVRLKSSRQINVPYLNFILQLKSSEGVVTREYAIFLDPQKSGKRKAKMPAAKPLSRYSKRKTPKTVRPVSVAKQKANETKQILDIKVSDINGGKYGPVRKGETLWSIASHVRPSESVSVKKMLKLLKKANTKALAKGLPVGVVLNVPVIEGYPQYQGGYAAVPTISHKKKTVSKSLKPKLVTELHSDMKTEDDNIANMVKEADVPLNEKANISPGKQWDLKVEKKKEVNDSNPEDSLQTQNTEAVPISASENTSSINTEILEENSVSSKTVVIESADVEKNDTVDESTIQIADESQQTTDAHKDVSGDTASEGLQQDPKIETAITEGSEVDSKGPTSNKSDAMETSVEESDSSSNESSKDAVNNKSVENLVEPAKVSSKPLEENVDGETSQSEEGGFPIIPVLVGGFALIVGLGAFVFARRKRTTVQDDSVILLDDDDFFADIEEEANNDTPLISFDDENPSEMLIETNSSDFDTIVGEPELGNSDELIEDSLLDLDNLENTNDFSEDELNVINDELDLLLDDTQNEVKESEDILVADIVDSSLDTDKDNKELDTTFDFDADFDFDDELSQLSGEQPSEKAIDTDEPVSILSDISMEFTLSDDELVDKNDEDKKLIDTEDLASDFITEEFSTDFDLTESDINASSGAEESLDFDLVSFDSEKEEDDSLDLCTDLDLTDNVSESIDSNDDLEDLDIGFDATDDDLEGFSIDLDSNDELDIIGTDIDLNKSEESDLMLDFEGDFSADELSMIGEESLDLSEETEVQHKEVSEDATSSAQLKLDLATSFVSISNTKRARTLLEDVIKDGCDEQVEKAKSLLSQLD